MGSSKADPAAHLVMPFRLKPGAVIVLEGLDGTGKSTQQERMEAGVYRPQMGTAMFDGEPLFLHMPSGSNRLGEVIYEFTESGEEIDQLARQLLHLAVHAGEVKDVILPTLQRGEAVFLDRFWWSTVAYGFFGGNLFARTGIDADDFMALCRAVWRGVNPDVIFLFMHPHVKDKHNTPEVRAGYEYLAEQYPSKVVFIDKGTEAQQNIQILQHMVRRGLYVNGE